MWDGLLIIALAVIIDRVLGDPPNSVHPLRWMGNLLSGIDRRVSDRESWRAVAIGFLSYVAVFLIFAGCSLAVTSFFRIGIGGSAGEVLWIVATAVLFKLTFAIFSFRRHCEPICADVENGRMKEADAKVQMIVSRDTEGMDADHVLSACCETVSENLVDSAVSPALYFSLFGITGAWMFRCANLMDAMWGYLSREYAMLGRFPAKFDDLLGYVSSRISPVLIAIAGMLAGMRWRGAVQAARAEHGKTPSPNSGWSMTATAAVLDIRMEKAGVYVMGDGPFPTTEDVRKCCTLVETASVVFMILGAIVFSVIGMEVQVATENLLFGFWSGLL